MRERPTLGRQRGAARLALAALALLSLCAQASAQKEAPGSIAGRVTDGERGIAGVTVVVMSNDPTRRFQAVARARTDAEGRYRIAGVRPGRYQVVPLAPVYVLQDITSFPPGKPVMLSDGDSAEDLDFRLVRGAVITGRVTDADGNPVVAEHVSVTPADPQQGRQQPNLFALMDQRENSTDDRGVFRIYGLQPGRYRVSVGSDARTFRAPGSKYYRRTFYPSTREEAEAKVVEVRAGEVADDVDITLGQPEKTFRASGRFVAADTGQPVPVSSFGLGMLDPSTGRLMGDYAGSSTNARGEFQVVGLAPGRYRVFTYPGSRESAEWYSEPVEFEVAEADVTGVTVKLRRGATVSGTVVVEGLSDRAAAARLLTGVQVFGRPAQRGADEDFVPAYVPPTAVAADGSFRLTGIRPGRFILNAAGMAKWLTYARTELNGAESRDGIEIADGAQVTGVRLVMLYGSAVLRGQLVFPAGSAPQGMRMFVTARRLGASDVRGGVSLEADARGRFEFEGLPAGEYEVQGRAFPVGGPGAGGPGLMSESQRVSISEGGEMTVTLTMTPMQPRRNGP